MTYDRIIAATPVLAGVALIAAVSYFFAWCGEPSGYWLWHDILHLL